MPLPKIADRFQSAAAELQVNQAQRIAELEIKVQELETAQAEGRSIDIVQSQLQAELGKQTIHIDYIRPNPKQPRRILPESSIAQMAGTLEQDGQLTPIVVVCASDNVYEIIDGHRRLAGAKTLGWMTIQAVVIPRPQDMLRAALLTFFHREDLNPLDEAEAIAAYVQVEMGVELEEFRRLLATAVRRLERQQLSTQIKELMGISPDNRWRTLNSWGFTSQECQLFSVLLGLGVHPGSFKSNRLPMLNLPDDLKKAIISGLGGDHALALSRLTSKTLKVSDSEVSRIRCELTAKVIEQRWSVITTRQKVAETIAGFTTTQQPEPKEIRLVRLEIEKLNTSNLQLATPEQLQALQAVVVQLQQRISSLLEAAIN
jgi:ParB family chromosome partitioning protein